MVICKYFQLGSCRYGQSCRFEHVYGSKYSYRANQNTGSQNNQNVYSNRTSNPQSYSNNTAASIFRSATQVSSNEHSIFGSPQNRISVFSRLGPEHSTQNAKSLFAQANQNVFQQSEMDTQNFRQSDAKSLFSQASQNVFGTSKVQNNPADIFGKASASIFGHNVAGNPAPNVNNTGNVFQKLERPSNVFAMANNSFEQIHEDDNIYSKDEELSEADLEAFKCEEFKLGFVPELPPPRSLCI